MPAKKKPPNLALTRKTVQEKKETFSYDLDGYLSDAIKFLQDKLAIYGPSAWLSYQEAEYGSHNEIALYVDRPETDIEFEARLIDEAKRVSYIKAREREEYERLKKKFEK